jgi:hypothetical protein
LAAAKRSAKVALGAAHPASGSVCVVVDLSPRKIVGIAIVEAPSLYHARMRAAVARIGKAADFSEGLEIDAAHVRAIPHKLIGKLLSPEQAAELKGRLSNGGPWGISTNHAASRYGGLNPN